VRVEGYSNRDESGTRLVIEGDSGLTLEAERAVPALRKDTAREIQIGDEEFDREVYVAGGDPHVLRAVLDVETRGVVRRFLSGLLRVMGGRTAVQDGNVVVHVRDAAEEALCAALAEVIEVPLEVARRLQKPASIVERLAENTPFEPEWRARMENLKILAESFPNHPATRGLLLAGCDDEHQEVQLTSAIALGPGDAKREAMLMELATRGWSDDPVAARAILALGTKLPPASSATVLDRAMRDRALETLRACLQALGVSRSPDAIEPLAKALRIEKGELAVAAARALGASGLPAAERPLARALADDDADVRLAAVEALGAVGSSTAVLPLKAAAERHGALRSAARQAIAAIHARAGASPGQVSLAAGQSGTLTLADDGVAGRLSMEKPGS
jgi:HEAT repeat protein